jgi:hypothetical protein
MSLGYAEKLSYHEDLGGQLGAPELFDADADARRKVAELAALVRSRRMLCYGYVVWAVLHHAQCSGRASRLQAGPAPQVLACDNIVVFTGAGISTSCGIPDFRQARTLMVPTPARANAHASARWSDMLRLACFATSAVPSRRYQRCSRCFSREHSSVQTGMRLTAGRAGQRGAAGLRCLVRQPCPADPGTDGCPWATGARRACGRCSARAPPCPRRSAASRQPSPASPTRRAALPTDLAPLPLARRQLGLTCQARLAVKGARRGSPAAWCFWHSQPAVPWSQGQQVFCRHACAEHCRALSRTQTRVPSTAPGAARIAGRART